MKIMLAWKPQAQTLLDKHNKFMEEVSSLKIPDFLKPHQLPVINAHVNGESVWYYSQPEAMEEAKARWMRLPSYTELFEILTLYPEYITYRGLIMDDEAYSGWYSDPWKFTVTNLNDVENLVEYDNIGCFYWSNTNLTYRLDKYGHSPFAVEVFENQPEFLTKRNNNPWIKMPILLIDDNN